MSPEERQLLQGLFDRMRNQSNGQRDQEAEQMIADNVRQQPYAPYLLSQTVIVQDQALQAANQRLQQLEQQVHELQQARPQQSGGFLSGLFGGGASQTQAPPPPQRSVWNQGATQQGGGYPPQQGYAPPQQGYPPQQQGGPWGGAAPQQQAGGGGFLKGALGAAAGVAGGVLLADSIRGLMGGHNSPLGIGSGMGGESVVNNYYGDGNNSGGTDADWQQDADQDQDAAQDAGDYGNAGGTAADYQQDAAQDAGDFGGSDDGSFDV